ncbi:hypothetical protein GGS23DRAFT_595146 [Durotheca rogersii]|uniref:uncharacterized protein n=1 Tax=Durotheca rogersii TaxID=419775 RepID=UPI00221F84E1|nr:uncharacterized protein GGS23DRAFT_595146 [Durotheca rogersii]KAI5865629.1 hypothetical protein GGS23DRAFT_595146 [Durotheca rogersii]
MPPARLLARARPRPSSSSPSPSSRRLASSQPPPPPASSRAQQRLHAVLARLARWTPARLRPQVAALRAAPGAHAAAFLALHEATAVLPLLGLAYAFHRTGTVPAGRWVLGAADGGDAQDGVAQEGVRRWMRYFRRRGWFGLGPGEGEGDLERECEGRPREARPAEDADAAYKIGLQIAAAYAITKMLFVPRLALSLWATPWLARGIVAARQAIWRKRG